MLNEDDFSCCAEINGFAKDSSRRSPTRRDVMPFRGVAPLVLRLVGLTVRQPTVAERSSDFPS